MAIEPKNIRGKVIQTMTEHKFTDEEIKRALECCCDEEMLHYCVICPYYKQNKDNDYCQEDLHKDALGLINRQKAEIERMKAGKVCSIGDKLYIILEDETAPGGWGFEINHVTEVGERFIFFSGFCPPRDDILNKVSIEDIGKDVFLNEAEFRRELERRRLAHDV